MTREQLHDFNLLGHQSVAAQYARFAEQLLEESEKKHASLLNRLKQDPTPVVLQQCCLSYGPKCMTGRMLAALRTFTEMLDI